MDDQLGTGRMSRSEIDGEETLQLWPFPLLNNCVFKHYFPTTGPSNTGGLPFLLTAFCNVFSPMMFLMTCWCLM